MLQGKQGIFEHALKRADDCSTYFTDFGRSYFDEARALDEPVIELMRRLMGNGLRLITDVVSPEQFESARQSIAQGHVAAVDGTNAIAPMTIMNATLYSCAVGWMTATERGAPHTKITGSVARIANVSSATDLRSLAHQLDEARDDQSWPTTFREYQERWSALDCGKPAVFIDGPIFTQNLITQPSGQEILAEIAASDRLFIGVIKDLRGSWAESKWAGYSLLTGEVYEVCSLSGEYKERFGKSNQQKIVDWAEGNVEGFSRYVYRPGPKAFGFECRRSDFERALALLMANASPTIGHETPLLLEFIDAALRGTFNGNQARDINVNRLRGSNRLMAFDIAEERSLR